MCVPGCTYVPHVCVGDCEGQKWVSDPLLAGGACSCEPSQVLLGTKLSPLQGQ